MKQNIICDGSCLTLKDEEELTWKCENWKNSHLK